MHSLYIRHIASLSHVRSGLGAAQVSAITSQHEGAVCCNAARVKHGMLFSKLHTLIIPGTLPATVHVKIALKNMYACTCVTVCASARTHVSNLAAPLSTFKSAVDAYVTSPSVATWDDIRIGATNKYTPFKTAINALYTTAPGGDFALTQYISTAVTIGTQSGSIHTLAVGIVGAGTLVSPGYVSAATDPSLALPSMSTLKTSLQSMATTFQNFGNPYSTVSSAAWCHNVGHPTCCCDSTPLVHRSNTWRQQGVLLVQ